MKKKKDITKIILLTCLFMDNIVLAQNFYTCMPKKTWIINVVKEEQEAERRRIEEERRKREEEERRRREEEERRRREEEERRRREEEERRRREEEERRRREEAEKKRKEAEEAERKRKEREKCLENKRKCEERGACYKDCIEEECADNPLCEDDRREGIKIAKYCSAKCSYRSGRDSNCGTCP